MNEFEYISQYFTGELPPDEMKQFDRKILQDPVFAEEVAFYCSAVQEIKDTVQEEKKKRFLALYQTGSVQQKRSPVLFMRRRMQLVAAAAIVVVALATWLLWWQPGARQLADNYIQQHFSVLGNTMGPADSLQTAIAFNNHNRLPEAQAIFENLAAADSTNEMAIKNAGIVSLRMNNYDKALVYFSRLEQMTQLQSNPGKFYKAITLLKRNLPGDTEMVKKLLQEIIDNNAENKEDATRILNKM